LSHPPYLRQASLAAFSPQRIGPLTLPAAKKLPQAAQVKQQPHKLVPEAAAAAADVQRFEFQQPSPDDVVLAAQQGKAPGGPSSTVSRPAAKPYQPLQQQQQRHQQQQQGAPAAASAGLAGGMQALAVADQQQLQQQEEQQQQPVQQTAPARRPLSDYRPDGERECARAAAAEEAGSGVRPRLHLVVLGHVDAGKSTLMGRMLYELGLISDKTVHKTQVRGRGVEGSGCRTVRSICWLLQILDPLLGANARHGNAPEMVTPPPSAVLQREAAATGKASFAWAWMLDERPEERARGVTVDVATTR
jgi:hypothetical protein